MTSQAHYIENRWKTVPLVDASGIYHISCERNEFMLTYYSDATPASPTYRRGFIGYAPVNLSKYCNKRVSIQGQYREAVGKPLCQSSSNCPLGNAVLIDIKRLDSYQEPENFT